MTTCAKCGSSLMPGNPTCPRCGATPGKGNAVLALSAGLVLVGAAVFFLTRSQEPATVPAEPLAAPAAIPGEADPGKEAPVLVPRGHADPEEAQQQVLAALAQASGQIEEAKKHVRDPEVRRQLDQALGQVRRAADPEADAGVPPAPTGPARCEPSRVGTTVRTGAKAVRGCFDQQLRSRPGLQGLLIVHVTVEPSGAVSSAEVTEDTVRDPALSKCVQQAAKQWKMPAAAERCSFSASFPFRSAR